MSKPNKSGGRATTDNAVGRIGTKGQVGDTTSSEGGQVPFMPSPSSYKGRHNPSSHKSGQSEGNTKTSVPFLPQKPKKGKP